MAKLPSHILAMARKGAEQTYEELKAEIADLVKQFPHLAGRARGMASRVGTALSKGRKAAVAAAGREAPRTRRKMSARARKKISEAQKKRWAAQKAKKP